MPYAQKNFDQKIGSSENTIAEAGALIVAISNLYEVYGYVHDPVTLIHQLDDHGIHAEDGLYLGYVSVLEPTVSVTERGDGAPVNDDDASIVQLEYQSDLTGGVVTTYAFVENIENKTIIDSYDGEIKSWDIYGGPRAYVSFTDDAPNPLTVTPLKAAEIAPEAVPLETAPYVAHVALAGYNTPEDAKNHLNQVVSFAAGSYVDITDQETDLKKIAVATGKQGYWINPSENVEPTPPAAQPDSDELEDTVVPVRIVPKDTKAWQKSWHPFLNDVKYYTLRETTVHDLDGQFADRSLPEGHVYDYAGWFLGPDDHKYYRTPVSEKAGNWYGVDEDDLKQYRTEADYDTIINDSGADLIAHKQGLKLPSTVSRVVEKTGTADGKLRRFFIKNKQNN